MPQSFAASPRGCIDLHEQARYIETAELPDSVAVTQICNGGHEARRVG